MLKGVMDLIEMMTQYFFHVVLAWVVGSVLVEAWSFVLLYWMWRLFVGRFMDAKARYWEVECLLKEEELRRAHAWKRPV